MRKYQSLTAAALAIVLSALAGGVFGRGALATEDKLPDHYRTFTAALAAIQSNYAESVESDRLVYGAINGMLQTLDPHSSFMDPPAYAQGIRRGDVIAQIEGESAKGWTTDEAVRKLRGQKGTFVNIGIRRKGLEELIPMRVMRDEISIPSIKAYFMIDS